MSAYEVSDKRPEDIPGASIMPYSIVNPDCHVVIQHRSNGQGMYMQYRSATWARKRLGAVCVDVPGAYIHETQAS
jgi:hypothetical protein